MGKLTSEKCRYIFLPKQYFSKLNFNHIIDFQLWCKLDFHNNSLTFGPCFFKSSSSNINVISTLESLFLFFLWFVFTHQLLYVFEMFFVFKYIDNNSIQNTKRDLSRYGFEYLICTCLFNLKWIFSSQIVHRIFTIVWNVLTTHYFLYFG